MIYMLLLKQDPEYNGSDSWWMKGSYEADSPDGAVRQAYEGTYLSTNRRGNPQRRDRVAVTGPGTVWQEFDIILRANPADVVSIEPKPPSKGTSEDD